MDLMLVVDIALAVIAISIVLCFYRVMVGPTVPDRVVALDTIGVNIVAIISLYSIKLGTKLFLDVVLVVAILGFVGVVAVAKFLQRGDIIDRDSD
ncbi:Na(+)/H(+) antiporter subunit F1 [Desulfitibacter alkalitolerans]|uniref:Na(+)/H(+) antiporter subunit F1 n=1 Tax=Desulfitibacter alkalitolerans TaxID=264641 RepID=UPI000485C49A|nr:Na(+)/H(+) antiporter subunit F1 [Desulfitibacter alkalitolerans]